MRRLGRRVVTDVLTLLWHLGKQGCKLTLELSHITLKVNLLGTSRRGVPVVHSPQSPFLPAPGLSDPRPVVTNLSTYQLTRMMVIHDMHRTYKEGESKHKP